MKELKVNQQNKSKYISGGNIILMKRKFRSMGRVAIALVLVLSLVLVMGVPVSAAVTEPTVTVAPNLIDTVAEYTIGFTTGGTGGLTMNVDTIIVTFPTETTTVPASYATGDITVNGTDVPDTAVSVVGFVVTITTPVSISASTAVEVIFHTAAGIENPSAEATYTLSVATSGDGDDGAITSETYTITDLPTVAAVQPDRGNAGETMWVEVTGTFFTDVDDLDDPTTTFTFGTGVSVVPGTYHFIDAESVDVQVTIASDATAGAREVTATTTAGEGDPLADAFTVGDADTPQVDVWITYTPVEDLDADSWDLNTLNMDEDDVHDTIQAAVDGATADDIVVAHAATYEETITINLPGITLESMDGAASTIIDANGLDPAGLAASMHAAAVMITAEGVTFGGTDKGFTVKDAGVDVDAGGVGGDSTLWADDNSDGIADVTGVYIWPNGGTNSPSDTEWLRVSVIGNTIHGSQARGIRADVADPATTATVSVYIAGNTVYDNLFHGFSGDGLGDGGVTSSLPTIIENNEFRNNGPSGGIWDDGTDPEADWIDAGIEIQSTIDEVSILSNDIHDNFSAGIYLRITITGGTLVIEENTIHDNGGYGIQSDSTVPGDITCKYNDINGNTDFGINNSDDETLAAEYNYWGAIGGPSAHADATTQTALGNGDAISDLVTYNPWLSVSQVTVITEGIRYYGSDTLALEKGWNTLSVPVALYGLANSITEIEGMGDFLTTDNYSGLIYEYDPVSGWETPITLVPVRGYYIKMLEDSNFPMLYSNSLGLPAFELAAGWNLIGSAFGIDKLGTSTWAAGASETGTHTPAGTSSTVMTDSTASFTVDELIGLTIVNETDGSSGVITENDADTVTVAALTGGSGNDWVQNDVYSIAGADTEAIRGIGTALDSIGAQASVVVSPSAPGQIGHPWSVVWANNAPELMRTGEGYWVFMTDTGTLAGWEITPFYFTTGTLPD